MNDDNEAIPDSHLTPLNPDEFEFLQDYWEMRTPAEVIAWCVNLGVELTKAQSHGWGMGLHKGKQVDGHFVITDSHFIPLQATLADEQGRGALLVNDDGTLNLSYDKE